MKINDKEIKSVSSLQPIDRYKYFLKKIADSEKIYSLENQEGDWASSTIKEYDLYPVWSSREFAINSSIEQWFGFNVIEFDLNDFIHKKIPQIEKDNFLLNVFPIGFTTGFVVKPLEFTRDINEELENYE